MELIQNFKNEINENSITCICVMRDEELMINHFISHYIELGITHFIFIDNNSVDNSVEKLTEYSESHNIKIYKTSESYAENQYGLTWVNNILNSHLKNKWVLVVDMDELLYLRHNQSLFQIKEKMIKSNSNILPTLLLDFYPRNVNVPIYQNSKDFLSHSNFYDKFSSEKTIVYIGNTGEIVVKGGMRNRVYPNFKEPVCITKKSFFFYDFYENYELQVGMHWILPKDFKPVTNNCWNEYPNWRKCYTDLRYCNNMSILGHFKYLKPNLSQFFKTRVDRNQDWGGSTEYKIYLENECVDFYDDAYSRRYTDIEDLYENTIDKIEKPEFIIVCSSQQHGLIKLCKELQQHPLCITAFGQFRRYDIGKEVARRNIDDDLKYLNNFNKKYKITQVYNEQNYDDICNLIKLAGVNDNFKFVLVRRNLLDSFNEYKKENELFMQRYGEYNKNLSLWFADIKQKLKENGIKYTELWFDELNGKLQDGSSYLNKIK